MSVVANVLVALVAASISISWCWRCSCGAPRPGTRRSGWIQPSRPRARRSPPTRASTTGSWPRAWLGLVDDLEDVKVFFLACVIVAGAYGAVTVNRQILVVQALPALVAFVLVLAAS